MVDLDSLGRSIQHLRRERGLTLQDLASRADVSPSMLSSVERGEKSPTITLLGRIADGLEVSLTRLVVDPRLERVIIRRAVDQDVVDEPGGWRRTILSPVVPGVNFEWIHSELPPGCDAGMFPPYAPGSHEYVAVESGTLRLTLDREAILLAEGDSIYFSADVPHGYANAGDHMCSYHVAALIMRSRRSSDRIGEDR